MMITQEHLSVVSDILYCSSSRYAAFQAPGLFCLQPFDLSNPIYFDPISNPDIAIRGSGGSLLK